MPARRPGVGAASHTATLGGGRKWAACLPGAARRLRLATKAGHTVTGDWGCRSPRTCPRLATRRRHAWRGCTPCARWTHHRTAGVRCLGARRCRGVRRAGVPGRPVRCRPPAVQGEPWPARCNQDAPRGGALRPHRGRGHAVRAGGRRAASAVRPTPAGRRRAAHPLACRRVCGRDCPRDPCGGLAGMAPVCAGQLCRGRTCAAGHHQSAKHHKVLRAGDRPRSTADIARCLSSAMGSPLRSFSKVGGPARSVAQACPFRPIAISRQRP